MPLHASREDDARKQVLAAYDAVCPGIVGNPYLGGHWPHPKQWLFLMSHLMVDEDDVYEALFGGAAGPGKSDALLMGAAQTAWLYPGSASVIVRRTHKDLTKPGAILDRAMDWWIKLVTKWDRESSVFHFPNGSKVQFGYHNHPTHDDQFHGAEYQYAAFDELTQFKTPRAYEWVRSRLRRLAGSHTPIRILSASNPGGPGHTWVQARFVGGYDVSGKRLKPQHPYFPATIEDNPSIDRASYIKNLSSMWDPVRREQLLNGDWDSREPGDFFRREWFGRLLEPEELWGGQSCVRVRWWDLAASEQPYAARTAGVRMARSARGGYAMEDVVAFRKTPGARDAHIAQVAQADGRLVIQGFEVEPGSGGIAQVEELARRLKRMGIPTTHKRPRAEQTDREGRIITTNPTGEKGKHARWAPVASCAERGWHRRGESSDTWAPWYGEDEGKSPFECKDGIRLCVGPWVRDALDELEGLKVPQPGEPPQPVACDIADAMAGAWDYLYAHPLGGRVPAHVIEKREPVEISNVHPADRPKRDGGKDRAGRWRP